MLFNSWEFIFGLLPIAFFIYFALNKVRLIIAAKVWLVAVSLFFYGYWNILYLPLIVGSMLANFAIGYSIGTTSRLSKISRKVLFIFGIVANLALLGFYKYTDFLIENVNLLSGANIPLMGIVLPLAISFFTFTQIAFLVDSYRGEAAEYDLINYALFITFFPHLIAGPIVHHREMMPQFASLWGMAVRYRNILCGLFIFGIGLFKKVVIADTFAIWAMDGFDGGSNLDFFAAWAVSLSYTFQIYFDFSGYCDMAIGSALLFNIRLPINFNSPYKALNIQDFWRRWHITLSRFLRDYLYIPLGGNRVSETHTSLNLIVTFFLGGLWHGASWMFVIWGLLHGAAMVVYRVWSRFSISMPNILAWLLTFLFVNVTWVFFRAKTMDDALRVLRGMADFSFSNKILLSQVKTERLAWGGWFSDRLLENLPNGFVVYLLSFPAIVMAFILISQRNAYEMAMEGIGIKETIFGALLFCVSIYVMTGTTSKIFLYFNF